MRPSSVLIGFVILFFLLLIWAYILRKLWTQPSRFRRFLTRASLSVTAVICLFFLLELLFYSTFAVSDTFGFTLASQRWAEKYWRPINSFGYRDVEHSEADLAAKKILFVVGDSFVAGHGISDVDNRLSNILQGKLGRQYVVVNIAKNGWGTADEYQAIVSYPHKPNVIVLAYFINDILGAAEKSGFRSPIRVEPPKHRIILFATNHSYFLNFAYWRLYRFFNHSLGERYWAFLRDSYANPDIWKAHEAELVRLVTYTQSQHIDLIVIVFPNLVDVTGSSASTSRVAEFFTQHGVRVINLEPLLKGRDPASMTVNSLDAHPNEELNREVTELLTRTIQSSSK